MTLKMNFERNIQAATGELCLESMEVDALAQSCVFLKLKRIEADFF